jgi:cephalosporin-C deacetylase-like acetyl esterase
MKILCSVFSLILLTAAAAAAQTSEELNFVSGLTEFRDVRGMLPAYLKSKAFELLQERRQKIAQFSGKEDVAKRKAYVRARVLSALGGLPERTPLNARVVGVLEREDYRIEKVIFESQPRFYMTANLYLPKKGQPPYPAILFPEGHEAGAKANETWQQILVSFAKKGFVALTWDPIGQGERLQFYDADLQASKLGGSTTEHSMLGIQCLLAGDNLARYTIWDGMRALDYLLSRKEVDASRIGCTGNSGGGTHTAYLSALDDRIQVAAPSCYLTSWQQLLRTIGPQDAEQNMPPWLLDGLDHPDFIYGFAPKPYLMLSAIRDFFSISGARETFQKAKRVYALLGAAEKLEMVEADDGHGYSKPRRLAAYNWFSRWLKGVEENQPELEIQLATEEELRCTPTGQLATSLGGETVFSLNQKRVEQLRKQRVPVAEAPAHARTLSGFEPLQGTFPARHYGAFTRPGYRAEKLVYASEPSILVPSLLFIPEGGSGPKPAVLYVNGAGKAAGMGDIEPLVRSGLVVLAIDARGFGETQVSSERDAFRYFGDYANAMTALLMGRSLVGMRAQDICGGVEVLAARPEVDRDKIYGFGRGGGAVPMLYATALDNRIRRVALEEMLVSYESVTSHRVHRQVFEQVVPGVLKHYDIADLVTSLASRGVLIASTVDALGQVQQARGEARVSAFLARP